MKKSAAGAALVAAVGFSALSAAPAAAVTLPFPDCGTAEAAGVFNIPADSPAYSPDLDSDSDGIGCENADVVYDPTIVAALVAENDMVDDELMEGDQQVEQMPAGAADTGVTPEDTTNLGAIALGGGLALALAGGGAYAVRRRNAS